MNQNLFDSSGIKAPFVNNFKASAIYCKRPLYPTNWGPTRRWIKASIRRSISVNEAIIIVKISISAIFISKIKKNPVIFSIKKIIIILKIIVGFVFAEIRLN